MKYRELELKDKLPTMTEEEQYQLLATDGMLVKRPLLLGKILQFQDLRRMSGRKPVHWRSRKEIERIEKGYFLELSESLHCRG